MVESISFIQTGFLTCVVVAGVTSEDLMNCIDIAEPMKELHAEMGGSEPFLQSAVAADLVQIEQHLSAELPVSLRVKETFGSDIFKFNQSDFLIVSSHASRPNACFHTLFSMKCQSVF